MRRLRRFIVMSILFLLAVFGLITLTIAYNSVKRTMPVPKTIEIIDYTDFLEMDDFTGVVCIGRASCQACAVVYEYLTAIQNTTVPFYYISLEKIYKTDKYENIKEQLDVETVPVLIEYRDGDEVRRMEDAISGKYGEAEGDERKQLYQNMTENIQKFLSEVSE